jgi:hypothetical protein
MNDYRARAVGNAGTPADKVSRASQEGNLQVDDLAAMYGLEDMQIGASLDHEQTVEQEFEAYCLASCSPANTDIIKFWEVSDNCVSLYH